MSGTDYVAHCLELLASLEAQAGALRAKRMFGGWGLYAGERFVALIADGRLYLKTDAQTRPDFAAAGGQPFVFEARGKRAEMSYWSPPDAAMDGAAAMAPWARRALQAAQRAAAAAPATKPGLRRRVAPAPAPAAPAATAASAGPATDGAATAPRRRRAAR